MIPTVSSSSKAVTAVWIWAQRRPTPTDRIPRRQSTRLFGLNRLVNCRLSVVLVAQSASQPTGARRSMADASIWIYLDGEVRDRQGNRNNHWLQLTRSVSQQRLFPVSHAGYWVPKCDDVMLCFPGAIGQSRIRPLMPSGA